MTQNGVTWNYTYNADGLRTSKSNGTTTYNYVYNGDKLSQMTAGSNSLYFAYDASGVPMFVTYNGTTYYYVTNVQGDIIGILDSAGTQVATYAYDAWGNPLPGTESQTSEIGTLNPLRYRSYIWDSETELYYLQSRYYNPEMGRFINGDAFASTGQGLLGNNMFAYCKNNPIAFIDPDGMCTRTGYRPWLSVTLEYIDCGRSDCPTSANYKAKGNSKNKPTDTSKRDAEGSQSIWRTIYNHNIRQQDIQNQVLIKQMELIKNGGVALWDAYMRGYSIQQYAHIQETQGINDCFSTPQKAGTTMLLVGSEIGLIGSFAGRSIGGIVSNGLTFLGTLFSLIEEG